MLNEFGFLRTGGESDFMKIYPASNTENDSVEILLNYQELKILSNSLMKFEDEITRFRNQNKGIEGLGYTHLHLKDCGLIDENDNTDIIFYLNLNE